MLNRFTITVFAPGGGINYLPESFTETQRAAILYICEHAGEVSGPSAQAAEDFSVMTDADWVLMGRRISGREIELLGDKVLVDASIGPVGLLPGSSVETTPNGLLFKMDRKAVDGLQVWHGLSKPPLSPEAFEPGPSVTEEAKRKMARESGFTGDMCTSCGSLNMKRNGACLCCADCGSTTGCS